MLTTTGFGDLPLWGKILWGAVELIVAYFGAMITVVLMMVGLVFAGTVLDVAAIKPIAWALDRKGVARNAKVLGLLLVIVGFVANLLAS